MNIRHYVIPGASGFGKPETSKRPASLFLALTLILFLEMVAPVPGQDVQTIDPSGSWKGLHGTLSLMLTGDALSFTYSAIFGPAAHLCDGVGVAGLVSQGEYHYVDEQGTVAFIISKDSVKLRTVKGIPSFCGANWPGDEFSRDGFIPLTLCTVSSPKAHFFVVMGHPPQRRKAYVLKGDRVEVVTTCFERGEDWLLARFKGPKATTVGLLEKNVLKCLR